MKFFKYAKKNLLFLFLVALLINLASSFSIKKSEFNSENENQENENEQKIIYKSQSNPPLQNNTNYTLGLVFNNVINNSLNAVNMRDFKSINLNSKFHALFDKQLEEIFLIFKKKKMGGVSDFRSSYALFIKYFNSCDKNNDLLLSKDEFSDCMKSDPYLSLIEQPLQIYSVMKNFTNATGYNNDIYDFANNYDVNGLNFYDYVMMRLFIFSWRKCTVSSKFMDEASFECAVDILSGTKTPNSNTLRSIFQLGLQLTNTKSMPVRTFDFLTYFAIASSIKLYAKINAKENFDATISEFNIALDNNVLPTRYSQDIIDQLFTVTKRQSNSKNGLDLISFTFYDHYLKLFYQGASLNRWTINSKEFAKICSHWLFPNTIYNYLTQVPLANFTQENYNLRAHIHEKHLDEEDNFGKFLEIKSNENLNTFAQINAQRYNNTEFNADSVGNRVFKLLDSNTNGVLTFYDFANFIQTLTLYKKTDIRDADRIIVSDLTRQFTHYSELPIYSEEFKVRSERFKLLEQDIYIDPFFTLAITRMDDYVKHFIRRADPTTVKEIELNLILDQINLKNFPAALLSKCNRGKDSNGIPKYDWECGITTAINKALRYLEYSRDLKDIQSHGFNLTYTKYDYADSK
jgi:hypothetical protein